MTSGTLIGWRPSAPEFFAQPVLDENAEEGPLCGAELPDGTGCLVWANGSNVRFAHTADTASWLVDDSVPSANMGTAVATGGTIQGTTVFMGDDGELYLIVGYQSGDYHIISLYQADSPTSPTSWSFVSDIWNTYAVGSAFGDRNGISHPLILDSGRWVLAVKTADSPGGPSFQGVNGRVFVSDDTGATWTNTYTDGHDYIFPRIEFMGPHIGLDPATGDLWYMSGTTQSFVAYQIALHKSADDGDTWSIPHTGGMIYTDPRPIPCIDNNINLWAIDEVDFVFRSLLSGSDGYPDNTDWPSTGDSWIAPGVNLGSGHLSARTRAIVAPLAAGVFFFVRDQVMFVGRPNQWTVGRVLMGNRGNPWR